MSLRIVFLGAGRLALPVFESLCQSNHHVVGLVTQPDKTGAGHHHHHQNPLKELALAREIPVLQAARIKRPESTAELRALAADLHVVAAYGQMLSREILEMPRLGTINVHASLLPKYRGATPIHAAVLNGDTEAGVTIIRLVPELDAGPMLAIARTPIGPEETTGELEGRLATLAVPLTLDVIDQLERGVVVETPQDHSQATHVGKLTKADGRIDWTASATRIACHVRGMQPWPGAHTTLHIADKLVRMQVVHGVATDGGEEITPGTIVAVSADSFRVRCGEGDFVVDRVHPEGKRPMAVADFLRGRRLQPGDRCE